MNLKIFKRIKELDIAKLQNIRKSLITDKKVKFEKK
jgi:hypothetical protein